MITKAFELASKICAVMTAAAIVLSTAATNVLFFATAVFCLAAGNWRKKINLIAHNPAAIIFLLFYGLFLLGSLYSTAPLQDLLSGLRKYDKFVLAVFFIPLFTEERWRNYAINAFLAAIFVMVIASYLRVYDLLPYGAKNGAVEVFRQSIEFNFLMAFAAYLCMHKCATDSGYKYKLLWITFLLVIIHTVLFRSIGRSGYLVFAGLMGLFFFQKLHWRGLFIAIISTVLLFSTAFVFSPTFKDRINMISSDVKEYSKNDNTSIGLRMSFVKNSIKLIKAHPFFGTGTGSFMHEYNTTNPPLANHALVHNPHNEYMYITVQFGVLGFMILMLVFGIPLWHSKFLPKEPKYLVHGTVLGIMLGCLVNSWLRDTTPGHFYAYFIMLAFAAKIGKHHVV